MDPQPPGKPHRARTTPTQGRPAPSVPSIDRDLDPVIAIAIAIAIAGLPLPWNSGAAEGHVLRVKMLKRQMFGRAGFNLLSKRVLLA